MYTNYHLIQVKYLGPTNNLGSRVKLISKRFEQSIIIDYAYELNNSMEMAEKWLESNGFDIIGHAEFGDSYIIITDTFEPLKIA